jgi:hypothetical protein
MVSKKYSFRPAETAQRAVRLHAQCGQVRGCTCRLVSPTSLWTYRKERVNTSIKRWFATCIRIGVGTKRMSLLQCSSETSRSRGGGSGYHTEKHNQLYLKALNRLTVAGNPEQQGLDDKKTQISRTHMYHKTSTICDCHPGRPRNLVPNIRSVTEP